MEQQDYTSGWECKNTTIKYAGQAIGIESVNLLDDVMKKFCRSDKHKEWRLWFVFLMFCGCSFIKLCIGTGIHNVLVSAYLLTDDEYVDNNGVGNEFSKKRAYF